MSPPATNDTASIVSELAKLIFDAFTAIGTIGVAILAIWGERIRSKLAPPKLNLSLRRSGGVLAPVFNYKTGAQVGHTHYYHLKVVNKKPWLSVTDCRVLLTGYSEKSDGASHVTELPVPLQFAWTPNHSSDQRFRRIVREESIDFMRIDDSWPKIQPQVYDTVSGFDGQVPKGKIMRFQLEIDAPGVTNAIPQYFEVDWDGVWDIDPIQMSRHLKMSEQKGLTT